MPISLNKPRPLATKEDHLELLEVNYLIPEGTDSSLFVELAGSVVDPMLKRVQSAFYTDRRFPERHLNFSSHELRVIFNSLHRPSILRGGHYYPFEGLPDYPQWYDSAFQLLLDTILPPTHKLPSPVVEEDHLSPIDCTPHQSSHRLENRGRSPVSLPQGSQSPVFSFAQSDVSPDQRLPLPTPGTNPLRIKESMIFSRAHNVPGR